MRSGKRRASSRLSVIKPAAVSSAACRPTMPATAPHSAEPSANGPSALSTCNAVARLRTHCGALVWVAVLKVLITLIQAAPPATRPR